MKTSVYPAGEPMQGKWVLQLQKKNMPAPEFRYFDTEEEAKAAEKKLKSNKNKLPKVLSREEISRLMAVPNPRYKTGLRNRVILQVLYRAGLRRSEVTNLSPADVNLEQMFLYIQDSKGGRDRYVPIDPETISWLKKWEEIRPDCDYYFCSMNGNKLEDTYLLHMLYRISEKAGVYVQNGRNKKKVTPHMLRHTYATELLEEGFGIHEVQQLLGHSSIQTTAIYAHVRPLRLAEKIRARGGEK